MLLLSGFLPCFQAALWIAQGFLSFFSYLDFKLGGVELGQT